MKKHLGNFLLFFLFLNTLHASPLCDYHFEVSNNNPFVKEGVKITFSAFQKDKSSVMFYELTPKKNADFELHFLKKEEDKSSYHDKKVRYSYLLYPLKVGELSLNFDFKISQASDKSMEEFASGNRDVIKPMMTKKSVIALKTLDFQVKETATSAKLFGAYTLELDVDDITLNAYEPRNITYIIKGEGYPSKLKQLLPKIEGVDQFLEVEKMKNGKQVFQYALSSEKDFTIPAVEIICFSPKTGKSYTLKTAPHNVQVKQRTVKDVLDKENSLPDSAFNWASLLPYLNGFLLFLAGYFTATLNPFQYLSKKKPQPNPMHQKIKDAKDEKALLKLLLSANLTSYLPHISALEESLYHERESLPLGYKKASLKSIKDALLTI